MSANLLHACQQHLCEAGQAGLAQDLREYGASMDELIAALQGILAITDRNHVAWDAAHAALAKAGAA